MSAPSTPHLICIGSRKAGTGGVCDRFGGQTDPVMPPISDTQVFNNRLRGEMPIRVRHERAASLAFQPAGRAARRVADSEGDREFLRRTIC